MYLPKNIIEDLKAWVSIINTALHKKIFLFTTVVIMTIPIWATEENAIIDFISVIFRQVILTKVIPINERLINKFIHKELLISELNRTMPKPPSFNKIPARIMDPYTGASTWAKGNHKCTPYIGSFTKNPIDKLILIIRPIEPDTKVLAVMLSVSVNLFLIKNKIIINIGTDEIIV